jgi:hypothetical protein
MKFSVFSVRRSSPPSLRNAIEVISLSIAVLVWCSQLFAQGNAGRILGSITDQTGGAVVGATVTIVDTTRNVTRTLTADSAGEYSAPNLLPGTYNVTASFQGFKTAERSGITLEVYQDLRVDLTMQPGEQSEKVTVTGELPLVETTNAELGGTIQNVIINDLPLNGRNFENLLSLRPGVTIYPGGGGWTQSTNGIRAHDNVYLVDGINSDDPWMAQSIMNAGMAAGDAGTILPIDAIDEFKTQENPSAEYGWKPGAVVNIGIKSGTNSIHGTAYAYGRDGSWDALNYFTTAPGAVVPNLNLEQFGASLGGPIKKDKLFYFVNYEDQRYTVGNPSTHQVPITDPTNTTTSSLVGACLAANKTTGATALSMQMAGLGPGCVPLSNFPGLFPVNNSGSQTVSTVVNSTNQIDSGLGKLDYHINDKNELHGSYFISPGNGLLADAPTRQILPNQLSIQFARAQVGGVTWTLTPNSTWVNELRVGYSHYFQTFFSNDHTEDPANYAFNGSTYHIFTGQTNPLYFGLFEMRIKNLSNFSLGASWPKVVGPDGNLDIVEHVSYLHGKHAFKFGGEILVMQNNSNVTANAKGPLRFDSMTTFFTGFPDTAAFLTGNLQRSMHSQGYAAFVQDDWRIKPRVMLNLGLRYEIDTVPTETNNLLGNFDPNSPTGLAQVNPGKGAYKGDHTNFSPRLGVAWDINGNGKTVLRAGASLIYEQLSNDVLNNIANVLGLRSIPTGVALVSTPAGGTPVITQGTGTINVSTVDYSGNGLNSLAANWAANSSARTLYNAAPACGDGNTVFPAGSGITPQPCIIVGVDPNLRIPYVTTWTLGIQRALTPNLSLDIAYVGDHGTKLISNQDINQAPLGAGYAPAGALGGTPLSEVAWCNSNVLATAASVPTFAGTTTAMTCSPADASGALEQAARPFNAKFPYLSYIDILSNNDFSNYNALQVTATQRTSHGLSFTVGYTYSHALDVASDNWGTQHVPIYPNNNLLYGSADTDIRHRGTISITYDLPGRKGMGQLLEGWQLNSIVTLQGGLPWWVQDSSNDFSGTGEFVQFAPSTATDGQGEQWIFSGNPNDFKEVHGFTTFNGDIQAGGTGGIPCFGAGLNAITPQCSPTLPAQCVTAAAKLGPGVVNALNSLGCYALGNSVLIPPAIGSYGTTGRNIFRDGGFKNWDMSVTKSFKFKERLTAQFRAEFFNLLNGVTFANPYGGQGGGAATNDPSIGAGFACGCVTADVGGSNPVLGSGGPRAIQLGLKLLF